MGVLQGTLKDYGVLRNDSTAIYIQCPFPMPYSAPARRSHLYAHPKTSKASDPKTLSRPFRVQFTPHWKNSRNTTQATTLVDPPCGFLSLRRRAVFCPPILNRLEVSSVFRACKVSGNNFLGDFENKDCAHTPPARVPEVEG